MCHSHIVSCGVLANNPQVDHFLIRISNLDDAPQYVEFWPNDWLDSKLVCNEPDRLQVSWGGLRLGIAT